MGKITLEDYLREYGSVENGLIGSSNLIDKLEIYGFVNACKDENMFDKAYAGLFLNGIVNKDAAQQIVLSHYIYQVTTNNCGTQITQEGTITPIFHKLRVSESDEEYNIEVLHVPSLVRKQLYKNIKSRYGKGISVKKLSFDKAGLPSYFKLVEGKVMMEAQAGHVQCLDKDGVIKSIGENLIVVCRYLHSESGAMRYVQYNLNEVYIDDIH